MFTSMSGEAAGKTWEGNWIDERANVPSSQWSPVYDHYGHYSYRSGYDARQAQEAEKYRIQVIQASQDMAVRMLVGKVINGHLVQSISFFSDGNATVYTLPEPRAYIIEEGVRMEPLSMSAHEIPAPVTYTNYSDYLESALKDVLDNIGGSDWVHQQAINENVRAAMIERARKAEVAKQEQLQAELKMQKAMLDKETQWHALQEAAKNSPEGKPPEFILDKWSKAVDAYAKDPSDENMKKILNWVVGQEEVKDYAVDYHIEDSGTPHRDGQPASRWAPLRWLAAWFHSRDLGWPWHRQDDSRPALPG
jgi:hypothetical protein